MDAFVRITGTRLAPWEIELIEMLDQIFMMHLKKAFGSEKG